ncbi:hypothetical protein SAMN06298216_0613 [Spirosomataceae bacterium TFI 002]|nr:hypothetical protein SAMN06298216_0613 [Spirosomataceae bacterium TFI 002]
MKKHTYFTYILVIPIFAISLAGFAQKSPNDLVKKFFKEYENDGPSMAIDNLYKTNKWMSRSTDAIAKLKSSMEGLNEDFVGKFYGYELIVEKKLTDSFLLQSYLVKFDRQPIRYTFQFYKPNDEWMIFGLKYDGNLDDEIEESAKLFYLELNN